MQHNKTAPEVIAALTPRQQELLLRWYVDSFDHLRMPSVPMDPEVENLYTQVVGTWQGPSRT